MGCGARLAGAYDCPDLRSGHWKPPRFSKSASSVARVSNFNMQDIPDVDGLVIYCLQINFMSRINGRLFTSLRPKERPHSKDYLNIACFAACTIFCVSHRMAGA
jgi:hypothetical protein